jgi:hypothetical protein
VVAVPTGSLERRLSFAKVTVVGNDDLLAFITSRRPHLDASDVDRIAGLLARK